MHFQQGELPQPSQHVTQSQDPFDYDYQPRAPIGEEIDELLAIICPPNGDGPSNGTSLPESDPNQPMAELVCPNILDNACLYLQPERQQEPLLYQQSPLLYHQQTPPAQGAPQTVNRYVNSLDIDLSSVHHPSATTETRAQPPLPIANHLLSLAPQSSRLVRPALPVPEERESKRKKTARVNMFDEIRKTTFTNHDTGAGQGTIMVLGQRQNVKGRLTDQGRKEAKETRKIGACERCRRSRKKCNICKSGLYMSCPECLNASPRTSIFICCRSQVKEVKLFRERPMAGSPLDSTSRREVFVVKDIDTIPHETRTIELTQDVGNRKITITASKYQPRIGEKTALEWHDTQGDLHDFPMPPYGLENVEAAKISVEHYMRKSRDEYIDSITQNASPLTRKLVEMVRMYIKDHQNSTVEMAVKIWAATRLTERPWRITGDETLGMKPISDSTSPDLDTIPVTPMMDTQLDQIAINHILYPAQTELLHTLQDRMQHPERKQWFENFLTLFILLSSIEASSVHGEKFARDFGLRTRYADMTEFESYFHGCQILLTHFHMACKGSAPFELDWTSPESDKLAELTQGEKKFLQELKELVAGESATFNDLKSGHRYASHLYWGHQLFEPQWKAKKVKIEEEVGGLRPDALGPFAVAAAA